MTLAKIFGFYFLAFAILALLYPNRIKGLYSRVAKDENFILLSGILALLIGAFIVSVHNVWIGDWPVLVTILGWLAVIKGYLLIIYPDSIKAFSFIQDRSEVFYRLLGFIWLVLAIFFIYIGWR